MFKHCVKFHPRSEVESQTKTSKDSKDCKGDTVAIVPQSTVLHLPSSNIKVEMEVLDHLFKKTNNSDTQNPGKQPISGSSKYPPFLEGGGCEGGKGVVGSSNNNGLHTSSSSPQFASLMSAKPAPATVSKTKPRDVFSVNAI